MVVKISICSLPKLYHKQELKILRHLKGAARVRLAPSSVARLVWDPAIRGGSDCDEFVEETLDPGTPRVQFGITPVGQPRVQFGITPVGQPFDLAAFRTPDEFENAMDSLLDGLEWLHSTARVIHRDLRPPNIIIDPMTKEPVVIDFDCAFQLPSIALTNGSARDARRAHLTTYSGGLICAPPRVLTIALEEFERGNNPVIQDMWYEPQPSDDLGAFVLLMMAISFPAQFAKFPAYRLQSEGSREEMEKLLEFYNGMETRWTWGPLWQDAQRGDIEGLRKFKTHGYWP